jgi:hypothetical protein
MTDLDQLLAETFDRRAAVAGPAVAPAAVHRAIARHRLRTAKVVAAAAAGCAAVTGVAVLAVSQHDRRPAVSPPVGPAVPTTATASASAQDGTVVEELPWAGTTALTLRRGGTAVGTAQTPDGYAFCFGASCTGKTLPAAPHAFAIGLDRGSIYGLAPHGTRKVLVIVGVQAPVSIPVSATDEPNLPGVMYGVSSISPVAPGLGAFSLSYRLVAYDGAGRQLAAQLVVGSYDLALAHPPVGSVMALPTPEGAALQQLAWTDKSGWACAGESSGSGAAASFGANVCAPPADPGRVALVAGDSSNDYVVLRVPATVSRAELRGQHGKVVRATFTDTGHGRLAAFDLSVGVPSDNSTITCWSAKGSVVLSTAMKDVGAPAGSVVAQ